MTLRLDVGATDGAARQGTIVTARGSFSTPCFVPVGTRGAVRTVSAAVGIAVAIAARDEGLAQVAVDDPVQQVYQAMWRPEYPSFEPI